MNVGILGGGQWGQALARLALAAGNSPLIAYRDKKDKPPHLLPSTDDPPQVSATCDLILVATSASRLREAIRLAQPGPGNRVVVAGRGLEPASGTWLSQVVADESDVVRIGALAGPAPVQEILNGALCAGVVASPFAEVRVLTQDALHSKRYRVYGSDDLVGTQIAGAVVPVLATLVGLAQNLGGSGVGMHAMVISRGIAEAARLAQAMGGHPATLGGLAGVGDLCASQGREGQPAWDLGKSLASGKVPKRKGQNIARIARALVGLAERHGIELPLIEALVGIFDGLSPLEAVGELMGRAAVPEWEDVG